MFSNPLSLDHLRPSEYYYLNVIDVQMKPKVNKRNITSNYTCISTTNVFFSSWATSICFSRKFTRFRTWSNVLQWRFLLMQVLPCREQNLLPVGPAFMCCIYHMMDANFFGTKILVPLRFYKPSWLAKNFLSDGLPKRTCYFFTNFIKSEMVGSKYILFFEELTCTHAGGFKKSHFVVAFCYMGYE